MVSVKEAKVEKNYSWDKKNRKAGVCFGLITIKASSKIRYKKMLLVLAYGPDFNAPGIGIIVL